MNFRIRYTRAARDDLLRLFSFLPECDLHAVVLAREAIGKSIVALQEFPFSCRKSAPNNSFPHEMRDSVRGGWLHVALFEIENSAVTIVAKRHQREDDYY